jgi:hypothetical protein
MEKLKEVFEANPTANIVFVSQDGQVFLESSLAKQHNKSFKAVSKEEVYEAKVKADKPNEEEKPKADEPKDEAPEKLPFDERMKAVEDADTLEQLQALLDGETARTVKNAINKKIKLLNS